MNVARPESNPHPVLEVEPILCEPASIADLSGHSPVQRLLLRAIDGYQRAFHGRPSPCRFFPSCSEYGAEAIHLHGAARGSWLTARRLVRCRPLGPSGFDPVPPSNDHLEH